MFGSQSRRRWAVVASLLFIAATTLTPQPEEKWLHHFWCWRCGDATDLVDLAINVALFVPLGLALSTMVKASRALLVIAATTVVVETLQYFVIVGRDGVVRDIVANVIGGFAAFLLAPHLRSLWRPNARTARRLAWAGATLWVAHAALSMEAFRLAMTPYQYYAQIAALQGQFDPFGGVVEGAAINGTTVFSGPFPPTMSTTGWETQPLELTAAVTDAPTTRRLAPILAIADERTTEIAFLAEKRGELVFRTRTRAQELGLRTPAVVLPSVFGNPADHTGPARIFVSGSRRGYTLIVRARSARESRAATLMLTPSLGWTLWWPFDVPPMSAIRWVTWLWLALPMAAIAFWSAIGAPRSRERPATFVVGLLPIVVAVVGAHVVTAWLWGTDSLGPWTDALAIALGVGFGLAQGASHNSGSPT